MKKTTGCLNSKYPHFPKVDIDMMLITEENKSTEFLYCLSLKKFPVEISIVMRRNAF